MSVYQAINKVQEELAHLGISKSRTNTQGASYKFRGIDDVYNTLSPLLAKHGLCILPRVLSRECVERQSGAGKPLFYVTVDAEFDFVSAEDGSKHTVKTFGEAMDSSDKATNKAMSAAFKYAAFQAFAIPTEGDNDADASTPDVAPRQRNAANQPAQMTDDEANECVKAMRECKDLEHLKGIFGGAYKRASDDQKATIKTAYDVCKEVLATPAQEAA